MKFLFVYRIGNVPKEKMQENGKAWWEWTSLLNAKGIHTPGFRLAGGKIVSEKATTDCQPADVGVEGTSVIEAESLEQAVEIAKGCPSLPYGGEVVVL